MVYTSLVLSNSYFKKLLLRLQVAEALNIDGTRLCKLPDLPTPMSGQTMSGRLLCGGRDSNGIPKSCIKFENGLWVELPWNLQENRSQHVSWTRSDGKTRLFGGDFRRVIKNKLYTIQGLVKGAILCFRNLYFYF